MALLIIVVAGTAVRNVGAVAGDVTTVAEQLHIGEQALRLEFHAADLNAWQTAYALDAALGQPIDDQSGSRAALLVSEQGFRVQLFTVREKAGQDTDLVG